MLRIHFQVEDLARVRMTASLGPVAESLFALDQFGRGGAVQFPVWRKQVRAELGPFAAELTGRDRPQLSDLLWLLGTERSAEQRGRDRQAALAFEFCRAAITPYWARIRAQLERVRDMLGRIAISAGVEGLLGALHPRLNWSSPVLEVPHPQDRDIDLNGRGLLLSPSLFLSGPACVFVPDERTTGMPALVFPTPAGPRATEPAPDGERSGVALQALVGHTRAAALEALTDSCTTGELSQRLGISAAGASKHATVLRKAGLVRTSRNRNSALHSLTGLGFALLRSRDLVAGPFRPIRSTTGDNTMSVNPFDDPDGAYLVLVNDQGQHSLWPSFAQVPAGWRVALAETDRQTALDHITANWTDMRPKSLIDSMNAEVA